MIEVENIETAGWEPALRGMRNPLNSWARADSRFGGKVYVDEVPGLGEYEERVDYPVFLGPNDEDLMRRLIGQGSADHCKFRRMLAIYCDVDAPLYWWKEFDTYKVGTVANSCSTMHTIMNKPFESSMFSLDRIVDDDVVVSVDGTIETLNELRDDYLLHKDGYERTMAQARCIEGDVASEIAGVAEQHRDRMNDDWYSIIQTLPSSWNQRRTLMLNYEVMAKIYRARRHHKLQEWHDFIDAMVEALPYPWIFTVEGC